MTANQPPTQISTLVESTSTSTTTYSLFDLIEQADVVFVESIDSDNDGVGFYFGDDRQMIRLSGHGDEDYHFQDQQVSLSDGEVIALDCPVDADKPAVSYKLQLRVERPLTAADLTLKG
jgi:hypothetical protein